MRVTNNSNAASLIDQLQVISARQQRLQNQAATGQRLTNAEDDPAAMGRVLNAQAEKGRIQQFDSNANQALSINQSSFAGFDAVRSLSDRASEISAMVGGNTNADSMKAYATEVNQLMEQAMQSGNTKLDESYVFGGTKSDTPPFTAARNAAGDITAVTYQGAASGATMAIDSGATISPFTTGADNQGISQFVNTLAALRDALNSGNATAVAAARPNLSSADDQLVNTLGKLGAVQTRIASANSANAARFSNLEALISSDADADLPSTMIHLNQTQTAYQAALQTGAKLMAQSLMDYVK